MMKGLKGRFMSKYRSLPTMASLKHSLFLPQLNLPTIHESFDNNNNSLYEITKDVQEESLFSPKGKNQSHVAFPMPDQVLEEFQELHPRKEEFPTLLEFQEKCPPGGRESVVLYTTSLRGINKTFEDCKRILFLLDSFRVVYQERDVSLHLEYREELWDILGGRVIPPRLFIRGRLIGGADEVVGLHERGALKKLFNGIPLVPSLVSPCKGCSGISFVLCLKCHGSCKITSAEEKMKEFPVRCPDCNENGLIKCPLCN